MTTKETSASAAHVAEIVRVWDFPTRASHGLIAILFAVSWLTAEQGWMRVHTWSGLAMLGVLIFRLGWAVVGSPNARFQDFFPAPARVLRYLPSLGQRAYRPEPRHSPLGGLSILALWGALILHLFLGLFAVDVDGLNSGPLASGISFDTGRVAAERHEQSFHLLQLLIGLHLAAIGFFWLAKKSNLIPAMITGKSRVHTRDAALLSGKDIVIRSLILATVVGGLLYVIAG